MDRRTDERMDGRTDGRMDGRIDGRTNKQTETKKERKEGRRTDGPTQSSFIPLPWAQFANVCDEQTDKQTDTTFALILGAAHFGTSTDSSATPRLL